jgi:hypothetical protein
MSFENKSYIMLKNSNVKGALTHQVTRRSPHSHTSVYNVKISNQPFEGRKDSVDVLTLNFTKK